MGKTEYGKRKGPQISISTQGLRTLCNHTFLKVPFKWRVYFWASVRILLIIVEQPGEIAIVVTQFSPLQLERE